MLYCIIFCGIVFCDAIFSKEQPEQLTLLPRMRTFAAGATMTLMLPRLTSNLRAGDMRVSKS